MATLIVTEQEYPIVDGIRPFTIRQQVFGLCSEGAEKAWDVPVAPANENHFSLLVCMQVSRQLYGLIVAKTCIDFQSRCFRKWFHR